MSSPTTSQRSSLSYHLCAIKKLLRDAIPGVKVAVAPGQAEFDALEQDTFEILRLIRSWRNTVAPINKIPPEILALVPDFLGPDDGDKGLVALTHVCRAWREVFVSRSSLWVDFDCKDREKSGVYLERSKSSPINLSLRRIEDISPYDPFLSLFPRAIGRLRSLLVEAAPEYVQAITPHLSHPAPLLEYLTIDGDFEALGDYPTLTSALFGGNLSSLRTLNLESVRTELPWRNMVNLTSFTLAHTPLGEVSIKQLLDFFEGAPYLRKVKLINVTLAPGTQNGRLVSLACLKSMYIESDYPSSTLLDHLLIPVGAKLTTEVALRSSLVGEHLPRSLGNLRNLSNFTTIQLYPGRHRPRMKFSGPNGEVTMIPMTPRDDWTGPTFGGRMFRSLAQLDTSKIERLEIDCGDPLSRDSLHQVLLPMKDLRTLVLSGCMNIYTLIYALLPGTDSSEVVVCSKLERLVLVLHQCGEKFNITRVVEMAASRASRGMKLGTIEIVDGEGMDDLDALELRKHVWNVECGPRSVPSMADSNEED